MAQTYRRLTAATLRVIAKKPGFYLDGDGLYLQVAPAGHVSWIFRYSIGTARDRRMDLGPLRDVNLTEARKLAGAARRLKRAGIDPIEERNARRLGLPAEPAAAPLADPMPPVQTFRDAAEAYMLAQRAGWRSTRHSGQWGSSLATYVFPFFGDLPVDTIAVEHVLQALTPIWTTRPETATRVRTRIENVLAYATAQSWRSGDNPARWHGHLANLLPKPARLRRPVHHAAMSWGEIGSFMTELRQQSGNAARALEFLILTAARTGEVLGARWGEIDRAARLWTIPSDRMKGGRPHRVPLSDAALAIVDQMAAIRAGVDEFVFPSSRPGAPLSPPALLRLLHRMGHRGFTMHGFRSAFADWVAEKTGFPAKLIEVALAHASGDRTETAYRRGDLLDRRRKLLEAWADYCAKTTDSQALLLRRIFA